LQNGKQGKVASGVLQITGSNAVISTENSMLGRTCRTGEISTRSKKKTIEGVVENENGDNKYAESADCVKKAE